MGKRLIKSYVEKPLVGLGAITRRQNAVSELYEQVQMRTGLRDALVGMFDIQRVITRIVYGSANARELRSLCSALKRLPDIKASVAPAQSAMISQLRDELDLLEDITETYNTMALYEDEETAESTAVDYSAREDLSI